jgi:hypothetical protein
MEINMREQVTKEQINDTLNDFKKHFEGVIKRKGLGTFASKHEIMGLFEEERREVMKSLQENDPDVDFINELFDVAVVCIFGATCINHGLTDW